MKLYSLNEMQEVREAVRLQRIKAGNIINVATVYDNDLLHYYYYAIYERYEGFFTIPVIMETLQFMPGVHSYDYKTITMSYTNNVYSYNEYFEGLTVQNQHLFITTALRLSNLSKSLVNAN